ncbi:MAG TPA: 3',5'-cyclic-AMP phosphodiesterase [Gammaproteobacteria bacterium]|nr:3',5'-cyclic-AMP phosphodiesterase [Gammaproteobacteria bacterium]
MPGKHQGKPLALLHISDVHLHAAADSRMRGVVTYESFLGVLEHAKQSADWPPAAVLVTGDIVQDESRAGYERFRAVMQPLGLPVYCVPGNHDDPRLMSELLADAPFQVSGEAQFDNWSLVLLNTFLHGEDAGGLGKKRLASLESALRADADKHVLICMHHHPLPIGSAWLDGVGLQDADLFLQTVDAHPHVRAVVCGHVHQASDRTRNGVRYLSTPSTCSQFKPHSDCFALDHRPPGLRWLNLHEDGGIETRVDWIEK